MKSGGTRIETFFQRPCGCGRPPSPRAPWLGDPVARRPVGAALGGPGRLGHQRREAGGFGLARGWVARAVNAGLASQNGDIGTANSPCQDDAL
jgi:hypothetical protein